MLCQYMIAAHILFSNQNSRERKQREEKKETEGRRGRSTKRTKKRQEREEELNTGKNIRYKTEKRKPKKEGYKTEVLIKERKK